MNAKKIIKGVAKTTGKYTLKALGKGIELTGKGTIKTVNTLVKNPGMQKVITGAGILAAGVMIPTVGVGLISALGLKYVIDKSLLRNNKGMIDEISDILKAGNIVTSKVSNKILSPTLNRMDRGVSNLGKKYQNKIEDIFR